MIDEGKKDILGVRIDAVDYQAAVERIVAAATDRRPYAVSALAVHGVMVGVDDDEHRYRLNRLDLLTPDGQPVRWALNLLHGTRLRDRVYGPELCARLWAAAAAHGLPVFFYGSRRDVLDKLVQNVCERFPSLQVAGTEPSKFRRTTVTEKLEIAARIRDSGAAMAFIGLGCPRQEIFVYEYRQDVGIPIVAVGAAFDYYAGLLSEPPQWVQRVGLQWLYRLCQEPLRLWRRYLILNPRYMVMIFLAWVSRGQRRLERTRSPRIPCNWA